MKKMLYKIFHVGQSLESYSEKYLMNVDEKEKKRILRKAKMGKLLYRLPYLDFFQCRCENLNVIEMRNVVSESKEVTPYWRTVNSRKSHDILCDKYKSFELFSDYYQRDVALVPKTAIADGKAEEILREFSKTHSDGFIIKPLGKNCGRGIAILKVGDIGMFLSDMENYKEGFVIEELIVQSKWLSQFHPRSVNTLRINTVNYGGGRQVDVKWPVLRIGTGDSIVDNAGAGGIFGAVDVNTGKVIACSDKFHHVFECHPDTHVRVVGFKIPFWEEACALVKDAAVKLPDAHVIGWDLALTDKGWVMVEGNYCPGMIYQMATGKGIRKEFNELKRMLKGV